MSRSQARLTAADNRYRSPVCPAGGVARDTAVLSQTVGNCSGARSQDPVQDELQNWALSHPKIGICHIAQESSGSANSIEV